MSRSAPQWAGTLAALALGVALTSCTSTSGSSASTGTPTSDTTSAEPQLFVSPHHEPSREEQVAALWEDVHAQRLAQVHAAAEPDGGAFANLATQQASEALLDLIRAARGDVPTDLVGSELWPNVEISAGGDEAAIADCILVATRPASQPDAEPTVHSQVWEGSAVATDDGWLIETISAGADNCVPPKLNRQLLDAYRAWHEAKNQWWDPPDPNHPLLDQLMVDPGLSDMRQLLAEHRSMGIVLRDEHDLDKAVVFELGIGTARISDCFPAHPNNITAYDQETGERREDLSPAPTRGQIDQTVADLERTPDGKWKVNGWRSTTNSDCTPGGTPYAVAP
ncbi:MAG: hypothetical protein M3O70_04475 [Actinomycetota bacterium]|nr:hypothetical protein [Actinomycetota bacterium]